MLPPPPDRPVDRLRTEVGRTADHLRRLPESRLRRRHAALADATAADAAHALAQWLADAAGRLADPTAPPRPVPRLSDLSVGDQVAVTGGDLVEAVAVTGAADVAAEAADRLAALRRAT